jgi:uncharacterized SAM-binding protein YcdF (DUF218 family)
MFFVLSKLLEAFTTPILIITALFLLSVFLRPMRWKKITFRFALFLLIFCSNEFIANEVIRWWEIPATPFNGIKKKYAWGILLTGVTKTGAGPSDRVYFQRGADRVTHTLQLYKMGFIRKILVSGGSGRLIDIGVREADEIASVLKMMGVNPDDIAIEDSSNNTHESAVMVKAMLHGKTGPSDCLLVTSAFHIRRSRACYTREGWPTDTFSTDFLSHQRKFTPDVLFVPKIEALAIWQVLAKEWVGFVAYRIAGYL